MLDERNFFTVTDLKQFTYCQRVIFYERCLPHIRPRTYKMDAGKSAHEQEQRRAARRSLRAYGLEVGERHFNVALSAAALRLRGIVDEIVLTTENAMFPVDYKLAKRVSKHHRVQLMAYALLLEATYDVNVDCGFIYLIAARETVQVKLTTRLRNDVLRRLDGLRLMVEMERMPEPTSKESLCVGCEFRRFCNDVL